MNNKTIVHAGNGEASMKRNPNVSKKQENLKEVGPSVREQFSTSCRICHSVISSEKLISPCLCKGSLAFVHLSCLERWLNQSGRDTCELCTFRFEAEQTRRYSICQGLRLWYRHPRHLSQLRADLVIGLVLTGVTLGLCSICVGGMKYFVLEGFRVGISYVWTEGVISFFLTVIVLGYLTTIYLMIRDHIVPWYHWWNRCVNVRLILDMNMLQTVDPPTINTSTEIPIMSSTTLFSIKEPPVHHETTHQNIENQTAVIFIPDISSNSDSNSMSAPPHHGPNVHVVPSIMSAVMSHIFKSIDHNAIRAAAAAHHSKDSKDEMDDSISMTEVESKNIDLASGTQNVTTHQIQSHFSHIRQESSCDSQLSPSASYLQEK